MKTKPKGASVQDLHGFRASLRWSVFGAGMRGGRARQAAFLLQPPDGDGPGGRCAGGHPRLRTNGPPGLRAGGPPCRFMSGLYGRYVKGPENTL